VGACCSRSRRIGNRHYHDNTHQLRGTLSGTAYKVRCHSPFRKQDMLILHVPRQDLVEADAAPYLQAAVDHALGVEHVVVGVVVPECASGGEELSVDGRGKEGGEEAPEEQYVAIYGHFGGNLGEKIVGEVQRGLKDLEAESFCGLWGTTFLYRAELLGGYLRIHMDYLAHAFGVWQRQGEPKLGVGPWQTIRIWTKQCLLDTTN
jgi:hypothetical protein